MKKVVSGTLAALALGCICTTADIATVEASPATTSAYKWHAMQPPMTPLDTLWQVIDGVEYYNGDTNYPIWDAGTGAFSVADLSSAVITNESDDRYAFAVISFSVSYQNGMYQKYDPPIVSSGETRYFQYDKNTGAFYIGGSYGYRKMSLVRTHRRALELVLDAARQHSN